MNAPSGYSGTPLPRKLGLKDGQYAGFVGLPDDQAELTGSAEFSGVDTVQDWRELPGRTYDVVHCFTKSARVVQEAVPGLQSRIDPDGMIWMSWPKKASKVPTDVTEDVIRAYALQTDLVDVKVCAVDEIWSGLKLVIRKELRTNYGN